MISRDEALAMIGDIENYHIERTSSTDNMKKFCEAICAFSNDMPGSGKNGYLILGAHDNGKLSGLRVDDKLYKTITAIRSDGNILPFPSMSVEKSLRRLDHWLAAHRNELFITNMQGERLLCKQDLAKVLGIARPTLDRWLSSKWLKDCRDHSREGDSIYYYSADAIKSALEKYLLKEDNSN